MMKCQSNRKVYLYEFDYMLFELSFFNFCKTDIAFSYASKKFPFA